MLVLRQEPLWIKLLRVWVVELRVVNCQGGNIHHHASLDQGTLNSVLIGSGQFPFESLQWRVLSQRLVDDRIQVGHLVVDCRVEVVRVWIQFSQWLLHLVF